MGTPEFAVPTLDALVKAGHRVKGVFTQPDRPAGRGYRVTAPPVKRAATALGLTVHQPEKIRGPEVLTLLRAAQPEAIVVVGYGKLIPQSIIDLPRHGCVNLHASLLPKYRGAAPVNWALVHGEPVTGVTTMKIDAGLDTGDILLACETPIAPDDDAVTLTLRLAGMGAPLIVETLDGLARGSISPMAQDHSAATPAPILTKQDGVINWTWPALEIANRVRGLMPWPGAASVYRGSVLHIWRGAVGQAGRDDVEPGTLLPEGRRLFIACGDGRGRLEALEVQLEGKRRVGAADFLNGARLRAGEKLPC